MYMQVGTEPGQCPSVDTLGTQEALHTGGWMQPEEELSRLCLTCSGAWGMAHVHSRSHQSCPRGPSKHPCLPMTPNPQPTHHVSLSPTPKLRKSAHEMFFQKGPGTCQHREKPPLPREQQEEREDVRHRHRTRSALPLAPSARRVSRSRSALQSRPPPSRHSPGGP